MINRCLTTLVLALGMVLLLGGASAANASDFRLGINFAAPQPCAESVWVPGTYVTRLDRVMVADAHYENRWVPPVYETRYDRYGRPFTVCVREGYTERLLIPAQYEMREVREWVPGFYREVPVACQPSVIAPWLSVRFPIGSGDHRWDYRRDHDSRSSGYRH